MGRMSLSRMRRLRSCRAGQSLSFASPKASNQRKGDPDIRPDPRFEAKTSRGRKLAALRQPTASSTFSLQISGSNGRGPNGLIFDRSATRTTRTRMRASGLRLLRLARTGKINRIAKPYCGQRRNHYDCHRKEVAPTDFEAHTETLAKLILIHASCFRDTCDKRNLLVSQIAVRRMFFVSLSADNERHHQTHDSARNRGMHQK